MSYDPNQDHDSGYANSPNGVPPSESYGSPQNPYGAPQEPYIQPQAHYGYGTTPQEPYGAAFYQQPGYGYGAPPVQAATIPLSEAIRQLPRQYYKVLTRPSAATFAEEMNNANWRMFWVQLAIITLFSLVISLLFIQLYPLLLQHTLEALFGSLGLNSLSPSVIQQEQVAIQQLRASLLGSAFSSIVSVPMYFFIGQGLYFFLAKAFHGTGLFLTQCYATLLFLVPLTIIGGVLGTLTLFIGLQIPGPVGLFIVLPFVLPIDIYMIVLQIFSLKAVHRLSGGKATAVVLIPYAVFVALYLILVILLIILIVFILSVAHPH